MQDEGLSIKREGENIRYEVTSCHSSDLLSDHGMSSNVYMVATVPPDRVPLTLKNDWDLVIVRSGWDP
jgi:hypothetical protein